MGQVFKIDAAPLGDARWFLCNFDQHTDRFHLRFAERGYWASKRFLDQRWLREDLPKAELSRPAARELLCLPPPPVQLLLHTGFCCSTLLADLLERPGVNLSLREPQILVTLDALRRCGEPDVPFDLALALLARRFDGDRQVTIKPSNSANGSIKAVAACTSGPMLFLWGSLESFLISLVRKGGNARAYISDLFHGLLAQGGGPNGVDSQTPRNDAQMAALAWHLQKRAFALALETLGRSRARSLAASDLLAAAALSAIDSFSGLGLGSAHIAEVTAGPLMLRHAKDLRRFDAGSRQAELDLWRGHLGHGLRDVMAWSEQVMEQRADAPLPLPLEI